MILLPCPSADLPCFAFRSMGKLVLLFSNWCICSTGANVASICEFHGSWDMKWQHTSEIAFASILTLPLGFKPVLAVFSWPSAFNCFCHTSTKLSAPLLGDIAGDLDFLLLPFPLLLVLITLPLLLDLDLDVSSSSALAVALNEFVLLDDDALATFCVGVALMASATACLIKYL